MKKREEMERERVALAPKRGSSANADLDSCENSEFGAAA
jgi:hypothetical protein